MQLECASCFASSRRCAVHGCQDRGIDRLIQNVMASADRPIFRNQASESSPCAYLQNRQEEQERAEARVRAHLLKYFTSTWSMFDLATFTCREADETQTEKILAEQSRACTTRNAKRKTAYSTGKDQVASRQPERLDGGHVASRFRQARRTAQGLGEASSLHSANRGPKPRKSAGWVKPRASLIGKVNALGGQGVALI